MTTSTPAIAAAVLFTGVGPDFGAVNGSGLYPIVGAFLTITLVIAIAMLAICAFVWAVATAVGSWQVTSKARIGVLAAVVGAVLAGGCLAWLNWLIDLGNSL